jgi:hypothetical protein
MNDHIPTCAELNRRPCWNGFIERGSLLHQWSGWPGAHCLVCFCEDPCEICLADNCMCHCHNDLWDALEKYSANDAALSIGTDPFEDL